MYFGREDKSRLGLVIRDYIYACLHRWMIYSFTFLFCSVESKAGILCNFIFGCWAVPDLFSFSTESGNMPLGAVAQSSFENIEIKACKWLVNTKFFFSCIAKISWFTSTKLLSWSNLRLLLYFFNFSLFYLAFSALFRCVYY